MKVLTVNCVAKRHSTGKIIDSIAKDLSDTCDTYMCYETGDKPDDPAMYRIAGWLEYRFYYALGRLLGLKYTTGFGSTFRLIRHIKKVSPDIVHLHCPNCCSVNIPWLLSFLKKSGINTVVTNHAEFYYTGNCPSAGACTKYQTGCGHCDYVFDDRHRFRFDRTAYEWKRMKKAFDGFTNLVMVAVSPWQKERMLRSPIAENCEIRVIKNGIDSAVFSPKQTTVREQLKIPAGKTVFLNVTSNFSDDIHSWKGGYYFIELAKRLPDCAFVAVGPTYIGNPEAIPANLTFAGVVSDAKVLAEFYSAADVTVVTSRQETFGLTCVESLCCGTPVIGFSAGGTESVALKAYSRFVEFGDMDALYSVADEWKNKKAGCQTISEDGKNEYSSETMSSNYLKLYEDMLRKD